MITHIVLWRFLDRANGSSRAEHLQKARAMFDELKGVIREIGVLRVGVNVDTSRDAADLALYGEFADMESLRAYQMHPAHQKVVEFLGRVKSEK